MATTEIAIFDKSDFEQDTIEFFIKCVQKDKIIKVDGISKSYAMFEMQDMNFLVNHQGIDIGMRQKLAQMMNQVNYVPKQHSKEINKYFFCIFF